MQGVVQGQAALPKVAELRIGQRMAEVSESEPKHVAQNSSASSKD
jgi:hypothetical protein